MTTRRSSPHPLRIFFISGLVTIAGLAVVGWLGGLQALAIASILVLVEITFSFDNAIINAKVLAGLSDFWRKLFLTVGIVIAVIGMRLLFPIVIVALSTGLPFASVIEWALYQPDRYAHALQETHVTIAAFGGMFLLLLSLQFFFDRTRDVHWIRMIERPLQRIGHSWMYLVCGLLILGILTVIPVNHHPGQTLTAGLTGAGIYVGIHLLTAVLNRSQLGSRSRGKKAGLAGFITFLYLQVLDASFSFDGVIGAFAVTNDVILIAAGLGIGAVWVRSLTVYMVHRKTLDTYRYLEHGAHYTIAVLAGILLAGIFVEVPQMVTGAAGVAIITAAIVSSVAAKRLS